MQLSIIIPAHNAEATLSAQLDALVAQRSESDCEILVVDNCSTDSTAALATAYADRFDELRLLSAHERTGAPYARNVGIAAARGRALAFCDSDDVVGPRWVSTMTRALKDHAYVTGPLDLHRLNASDLVFSRGSSIESTMTPPRFCRLFPFGHGCNLGVQADLVEHVGGFDERFPCGEDVELGFRVWRKGIPVHFEPDALVHYRIRASHRARFHQAKLYGRARPPLLREMARAGVDVPSRLAGLRRWGWLVRELPGLGNSARRARWSWVLATQLGQVEGSVRHRTVYL